MSFRIDGKDFLKFFPAPVPFTLPILENEKERWTASGGVSEKWKDLVFEMSSKISCVLQLKLFIFYDLALEKHFSCLIA